MSTAQLSPTIIAKVMKAGADLSHILDVHGLVALLAHVLWTASVDRQTFGALYEANKKLQNLARACGSPQENLTFPEWELFPYQWEDPSRWIERVTSSDLVSEDYVYAALLGHIVCNGVQENVELAADGTKDCLDVSSEDVVALESELPALSVHVNHIPGGKG